MSIERALQGVLMILVLVGTGVLMARLGYLTEELETSLSRLTIHFSVPAMLFGSTVSHISGAFLRRAGWLLLIPLVCMLLGYGLGFVLRLLCRIPRGDTGVFLVMFALSNSIFIGLPVALEIFGESAMPYVVAYFPFNTTIFWTLGNLGIAADGGRRPASVGATIRQIFSPPFFGFLAGFAVALTGLTLPPFLTQAVTYLGNLTVPVTLLTTGAVLSRMGRASLHLGRAGWLTLFGRLVLMPGVTMAACLLCGAPPMMTGVFTMIAAMPVMNQCVIMARLHGANHRLAAQMLTVSTLFSLAGIPLWVLVLQWLT
ncbi:MAG: AEC family transporter [Oscillospiraceae bacterium]|nr:AEC family transporter [Oscillospiraceae bacterium]